MVTQAGTAARGPIEVETDDYCATLWAPSAPRASGALPRSHADQ